MTNRNTASAAVDRRAHAGVVGEAQIPPEPDERRRRGAHPAAGALPRALLEQIPRPAMPLGEGACQLAPHDEPIDERGRAGRPGSRYVSRSVISVRPGPSDWKRCSWRQDANGERSATSTMRLGGSTASIRTRQRRGHRGRPLADPHRHDAPRNDRKPSLDRDDARPRGRDQPGVAGVQVEGEDVLHRSRDLDGPLDRGGARHPVDPRGRRGPDGRGSSASRQLARRVNANWRTPREAPVQAAPRARSARACPRAGGRAPP